MSDPSPDEVKQAVDEVWEQVVELAATPEGIDLMQAAAACYPEHKD